MRRFGMRDSGVGSLWHGYSPYCGLGPCWCSTTFEGRLRLYDAVLYKHTMGMMSTHRHTKGIMLKESKRTPFAIRMQPSVKAAGEMAAVDANRSLSSLMETLLIAYLNENGYLPSDDPKAKKQSGAKRR